MAHPGGPTPGQAAAADPLLPPGDGASRSAQDARHRQFGSLLKISPQAIVILDADGRIREWNPAAVHLLGWARTEMLGVQGHAWLPEAERADFAQVWSELWGHREARAVRSQQLHRDGRPFLVEIYLAPIQDSDGSFAGVVATVSPDAGQDGPPAPVGGVASGLSALETDDLTDLPGRRWLQRRLAEPVAPGLVRALAVIDVDAFALVNQEYGADAADEVLCVLARRLAALGSVDAGQVSLGRWQADEFLLVLDDVAAGALLAAVVDEALTVARTPFPMADGPLSLSVSAGYATTDQVPASQLFRAAAAAMAVAKGRGRNASAPFDGDLGATAAGSGLRLADDLGHGVAGGELRLHFQPILELATNDVAGVEALVRWQRPGVGLLSPAAFIEVAERTGQIVALGAWVIGAACRAAAELGAARLEPLRVSINVSARQLSDPHLLEVFQQALREAQCDARDIVVEVTESALLHDLGAATTMLEAIKELGIDLDLDDFGTGYSSLVYLKHFPVSRIKIDRSFVAGLGTDLADTAIVASTIALAHSVGITALAEGVETARQLTMLRQMGCDFAQGYLISRPVPQDELVTWLLQLEPSRLLGSGASREPEVVASLTDAASRHQAADRRDEAGDVRELVGDERDRAGDQRERAGDQRDAAGDRRDTAADARDELADRRDRVGGADGADGPGAAADPGAARQRALAAGDRSEASRDRERGATERSAAEAARGLALSRRDVVAERRVQAGRDRLPDPPPVPAPRPPPGRDSLTGAHLREDGWRVLSAEQGRPLSLVCLQVTGPDGSQLSDDRRVILLANALYDCLAAEDVLVRTQPAEFLVGLPGLSSQEAAARVAPALSSVAGAPPSVTVSMRVAAWRDGESLEELLARVRAGGPTGDMP